MILQKKANFCLEDWLAIPFEPHGRDFEACDCWGLVRLFYGHVFAIELPSFARQVASVDQPLAVGGLMGAVARGPLWRPVDGAAFFGDVIIFGTRACFYHVGLYIEPGFMLHTRPGTDSTVEAYDSLLWRPRLQGFYRHFSC